MLHARGLVKRYGHVTALDGIDFELLTGEILAIVGDNGAGKSSLIKALAGAIVPDEGEIGSTEGRCVFAARAMLATPASRCCYQDLAVAPAMTVAENLFLGRELRRPGLLGTGSACSTGGGCSRSPRHGWPT